MCGQWELWPGQPGQWLSPPQGSSGQEGLARALELCGHLKAAAAPCSHHNHPCEMPPLAHGVSLPTDNLACLPRLLPPHWTLVMPTMPRGFSVSKHLPVGKGKNCDLLGSGSLTGATESFVDSFHSFYKHDLNQEFVSYAGRVTSPLLSDEETEV